MIHCAPFYPCPDVNSVHTHVCILSNTAQGTCVMEPCNACCNCVAMEMVQGHQSSPKLLLPSCPTALSDVPMGKWLEAQAFVGNTNILAFAAQLCWNRGLGELAQSLSWAEIREPTLPTVALAAQSVDPHPSPTCPPYQLTESQAG